MIDNTSKNLKNYSYIGGEAANLTSVFPFILHLPAKHPKKFFNMSSCSVCSGKLSERKSIKCEDKTCGNFCHFSCLPDKSSDKWRCKTCTEPSWRDIMKQLTELTITNKELIKSVDLCHEKIDENSTIIKSLENTLAVFRDDVVKLSDRCTALEGENTKLKSELNDLQQYSRRNNIEIRGVPEAVGENVTGIVNRIGMLMGVDVNAAVDISHRVGKKLDGKDRPIIVKFLSCMKKQEFLNARKVRRNLCVRDLGDEWKKSVNNTIYINEHLTIQNKILLNKCRDFKKNANIKHLWVKNGKIYMRKADNTKVFVILNQDCLNDVH